MQARKRGTAAGFRVLLLCAWVAGCGEATPPPVDDSSAALAECGAHFDPTTVGTICGRVTWRGDLPQVPPFRIPPILPGGVVLSAGIVRENANAPLIEPRT